MLGFVNSVFWEVKYERKENCKKLGIFSWEKVSSFDTMYVCACICLIVLFLQLNLSNGTGCSILALEDEIAANFMKKTMNGKWRNPVKYALTQGKSAVWAELSESPWQCLTSRVNARMMHAGGVKSLLQPGPYVTFDWKVIFLKKLFYSCFAFLIL